jgi:hypothetical protein
MEESVFQQMVGFFVEFAHLNYNRATSPAKDMLLNTLEIITSGRTIMKESTTFAHKLVPDWKYIRVWRNAYPDNDKDFIINKGSNCKPRRDFLAMESVQIIKRRLLCLAAKGHRNRSRFGLDV